VRNNIPYIDRLAQAQWFERFGFVAFAIFGCLGIIVGKVVGLPALAVTGAAVAIMVVYATIMWRAIAGRVRADQAGDNLYYMGLLFTLTGLAYAIFTFDPENHSNAIVEGFGIALATTIFGLMLRVFFNQVRADLVEIEDRARMDLAEAANELKAELKQIVIEMNDFGRQTRQSLGEAVSGVEHGMITTVKEAGAGLAKLSSKAEEKVTAAFSSLETCANELIGSTKEASTAIAETAKAVRDNGKALDAAAAKLSTFADNAERTAGTSERIAEQAEQARSTQQSVAATADEMRTQIESVTALLTNVRASLESAVARQDERLSALEKAPTLAAEQVAKLLSDLETRVRSEMERVAAANAEAVKGQLAALETAVGTMREYNGALADELTKAKGYTSKVQANLVAAVDNLTDHLDGGPSRQ
jgi:hypothetical protein